MNKEIGLPGATVDVAWLIANISNPRLIILDASWYLPDAGRSGPAEFEQKRLPGAQFFDFDTKIADQDSTLPHMLPTPAIFEAEVRSLGVNSDSIIICYDGAGVFSAPRAWWMFKAFGHTAVAVLNGGLPAYEAAGGAMETGVVQAATPGNFVAKPDASRIADAAEVLGASQSKSSVILDARGAARFRGEAQEPRPGLRAGHIPNSTNLPFTEVVADGRLLPSAELFPLLTELGLTRDASALTTCGSGVTASVLALAIEEAGLPPAAVYDGSWSEWGGREDLPIEKG